MSVKGFVQRIPQMMLGFALAYAGIGHLTTSRMEFSAQVPTTSGVVISNRHNVDSSLNGFLNELSWRICAIAGAGVSMEVNQHKRKIIVYRNFCFVAQRLRNHTTTGTNLESFL